MKKRNINFNKFLIYVFLYIIFYIYNIISKILDFLRWRNKDKIKIRKIYFFYIF